MWALEWIPFWIFHVLLIGGILGLIFAFVLSFIPFISKYKLPIQVGSLLLIVFGTFMEGAISNQEAWLVKVADLKVKVAQVETKSAEKTTEIVTKYVTKVQVVKEKGDVIIKEVPKYITKESDAKCTLPNSFVMLHDSASKNEVPDSTRVADETTSGVKLSTATGTVVGNYSICHQNSEQLKALQEWVKEQEKLFNKN